MTFSYLFLSLTLYLSTSKAADWCYEIQTKTDSKCKGPGDWSQNTNFCGQDKQSPINVITCTATFDSKLKPFKFEGYDKEQDCVLKNTGHSVELDLLGKETIAITGGGLSGTYTAKQLHFHWGSKNNSGSEHSLNGEKYPIELHIVHEKKLERSESAAGSTSGGLAVLGFFLEQGSDNEPYNNLINGFDSIAKNGTTITISKVKLQDLIPNETNLELFYRYEGSLTTPDCNETVTWTVFPEKIKLSQNQIEAFYTKIKYNDNQVMAENFRPIQKLNGRTVYTSGVDVILPHIRYLFMSLFVLYLTSIS